MGQFWSIRRKSPLKVKELQKSKSVVRDNSQVFCSGEYEEKQKKADAPTLPSGYYLVRQRKIRGKIHNHLHSDLLISAVTDTNNNVTLGNKRHVTTTEGIKQSSANFSSGQESGLIKHLHNTYSNAGYNHSPTNDMLRTTTTTCQLPQNNYLEAKSIYSEATVQSEPIRRYHHHHHQHRHHHRHHRRKRNKAVQNHHHHHHHQQEQQSFGYDINNVDEFLSKCSLLSPANIPVVLSCSSTLYQTRPGYQREIPVSLGMVVNAVFKIQQWVYVQTPHGEEGYLTYSSCLPLGILPANKSRSPSSRSGPERCWETTEDVYRKPGSWTDSEKEYRLRSARSEGARTPSCSEKNLDNLYLKAASQSKLDRTYSQVKPREKLLAAKDKVINYSSSRSSPLIRETLLAVQMNYSSSAISVFKGDVVTLLGRKEIRDINSKKPRQWFYVRSRSGTEAFIPAEVAGHGYL